MPFSSKLPLIMFFCSLIIHSSLAEVMCEELQKGLCSFSIASSRKRCLLETEKAVDGALEYQCRTSEAVVERMAGYI
ncbi:PAR1 protein [Medicago truncatula]|uniref:PAR1 protein n=1 Tax=Medicago truncatula TaxID=3880 RepID=A0A072UB52_MEDTR|nr:PAR1 protein [Medicago truncatula]